MTEKQYTEYCNFIDGLNMYKVIAGGNCAQLTALTHLRRLAWAPHFGSGDPEHEGMVLIRLGISAVPPCSPKSNETGAASGLSTDVSSTGSMAIDRVYGNTVTKVDAQEYLEHSSKLQAVAACEKVVVVSNYMLGLDVISHILRTRGIEWFRLDGSTSVTERQDMVDQFNSALEQHRLVFLLSAQAGGVGLNLVGASQLVLMDPHWYDTNPAIDSQAMARIWRDGAQKPVSLYRLLSGATIEEKMYQRQLSKQEVASLVVEKSSSTGSKPAKGKFSQAELKELLARPEHRMMRSSTAKILQKSTVGSSLSVYEFEEPPYSRFPSGAKGSAAEDAVEKGLVSCIICQEGHISSAAPRGHLYTPDEPLKTSDGEAPPQATTPSLTGTAPSAGLMSVLSKQPTGEILDGDEAFPF
eukprot:scaffold3068_cov401-Prasinococcus_capsulatus_cf.AAC.20